MRMRSSSSMRMRITLLLELRMRITWLRMLSSAHRYRKSYIYGSAHASCATAHASLISRKFSTICEKLAKKLNLYPLVPITKT